MFDYKEIKIIGINCLLNKAVLKKFLSSEIKEIRLYSRND